MKEDLEKAKKLLQKVKEVEKSRLENGWAYMPIDLRTMKLKKI